MGKKLEQAFIYKSELFMSHQITSEVTGYFGARCKTRACFFKCDKNAIQFVLCWTTGIQFVEDNKFLANNY